MIIAEIAVNQAFNISAEGGYMMRVRTRVLDYVFAYQSGCSKHG
jgi:hypothetical protein